MRFVCGILLLIGSPALAQLNADFSASVTQGCTDLNVAFKDQSAGSPTSWFWDFGNGQTSSLQNPVATYTAGGKYTVRLIVKTAIEDDYEEKTNYITVFTSPQANFLVSGNDSGCAPVQTSFKDISTVFGTTINSWSWNFGDAGTSTQQNPIYTYNAAGNYDVTLIIQTTQGCSSSTTVNSAVIAGNKPVVDFSASPLKGCASTFRSFKNKTPGPNSAYYWDFGDGGTNLNRNPDHHYSDTGYFTVKLKVSNNGCIDSAEKIDYIHTDGAAAKLNRFNDCSDRFTYNYRDISIAETGRMWDFGDGTTSTDKAISHTYSTPGVYIVKLSVTGAACNDSTYDTLHIKTGNPVIGIIPQKNAYCRNDSLTFFVSGYDTAVTKTFAWNFRDGFQTDFWKNNDTINYVYNKNGNFRTQVYVKNVDNCVDTISLNSDIKIGGPIAEFQSAATGCTNSNVSFRDQSTTEQGKPITQWLWSFGDGTTNNTNGPLNYAYTFPGIYNVNLSVTDVDGCIDTITHQVDIDSSPVVDAGIDTFTCAGSGITLNATGASNYVWQNNPDLSCTNCANPVANPQQQATYFVTGTSNGCSATDSVKVLVQAKELISVEANKYAICAGGNSVMLIASGTDSYLWSPSNTLSSAIVPNPVAFPSTNTTYTVTGKDSRNCFTDIATVDVIVNETPSVNIADSVVQIMTGFNYTILGSVSNDVQTYEWIPPTGLSCTNCLQPIVTVTNTAEYTLVGTNNFGCTDSAHITIIAACSGDAIFIPNTFSPNNDGMNDYFFPRSGTTISIKSLSIFNRWGQLVFQKQNFLSNNAADGWNGKYKNQPQQSDVYIYMMELECSGNKAFIKKGNVSLIH